MKINKHVIFNLFIRIFFFNFFKCNCVSVTINYQNSIMFYSLLMCNISSLSILIHSLFTENMTSEQRKENHLCDITYVTNSELGFDYLRDNLASVCKFHHIFFFLMHAFIF